MTATVHPKTSYEQNGALKASAPPSEVVAAETASHR